jgi:histidinol-phosphate aminotransferase
MSSAEVAARYGVPEEQVVRFDTNTSPFLPVNLSATLADVAARMPLNEYPDTSYRPVMDAIVSYTGLSSEHVVIGCGADEVLDMIAKVFVDRGARCVVTSPSYGMYPVLVDTYGGTAVGVPDRSDLTRDVEAIARAARDASLVWLCNPNNPTAHLIPLAEVEWLAEHVSCPLVVDEAYFEFTGVTAAGLIERHPHVIVVRTLSKAFSLAGLRVGYALAAPETAAMVNRVRPPNSVGTLSIALAAAALRDLDTMRERVRLILAEKPRFVEALRPHVAAIYPSAANFMVVRAHDAPRAIDALLRAGIVVRDVSSKPGLAHCLRPTVRLPEENARFVEAIARAALR